MGTEPGPTQGTLGSMIAKEGESVFFKSEAPVECHTPRENRKHFVLDLGERTKGCVGREVGVDLGGVERKATMRKYIKNSQRANKK